MNNIVVLSVDCLRADQLGCYGYIRDTSQNIDKFADSATVYNHSYANGPGTRWAFQSFHTGVSSIFIDGLGIPDDYEPLASKLSNHGYSTGWFGVNGLVSRDFNYHKGFNTFYGVRQRTEKKGLVYKIGKRLHESVDSDVLTEKLFQPVHDRFYMKSEESDTGESVYQPSHTDRETVEEALSFIESQQRAGESYFCWIHFMDAHTPYGRWPDHLEAVRGDTDMEHTINPLKEGKTEQGQEPPATVTDTYDSCVRRVDELVGQVLDAIDDNTTVVLTGDHGEDFGSYRGFHVPSFYHVMTRVPIIVRGESFSGSREDAPAQHLDIPPTILTAADVPVPDHWQGQPLQSFDRDLTDAIYFGLDKDRVGIRKGQWKFIDYNETALYRTPHGGIDDETVTDEYPEKADELRSLLEEYRSRPFIAGGEPEIESDKSEISDEVEENLEELGYL